MASGHDYIIVHELHRQLVGGPAIDSFEATRLANKLMAWRKERELAARKDERAKVLAEVASDGYLYEVIRFLRRREARLHAKEGL